jgi:hypothetical protein
MAVPSRRPHSRARQVALVVAGSFLAHAWVLGYVATKPIDLPPSAADAEPAVPVEFAPRLRPLSEKTKPAKKAGKTKPASVQLVARPTQVAAVDPAPFDSTPQLQAPVASPISSGGPASDDPVDLGSGPLDITAATPPPGHYPINPGYWQVAEHWLLINRTERYCVEPWDITRFIAAPCNHLYHCSYPVQRIEADRLHFAGVIWRHDERYNVTGGSAFSPTSLHLSVTGMGHFHLLPFAFSASLDGKYLGADCPADAKRIHQAPANANG